jgi:hypothetical protein
MILNKNSLILVSLGLSIVLFSGCGSSSSSDGDTNTTKEDDKKATEENNETQNNSTSNDDTKEKIVVGYATREGVLIETKSDGTKLAWVNTSADVCKVSREESREPKFDTVYQDAKDHCQNLSYKDITTWRVPTVEEAVYLMQNVDKSKLLYPSSNVTCQFMATDKEATFVKTTNTNSKGQSFEDQVRNREKAAGIRCVANQ